MAEPARHILFQAPPLTFDRDGALTYTGLAPKLFDQLERAGTITGRRVGRGGGLRYTRTQLEDVVASIFGAAPANDIDGEFAGLPE
jgi:hypothetical protein